MEEHSPPSSMTEGNKYKVNSNVIHGCNNSNTSNAKLNRGEKPNSLLKGCYLLLQWLPPSKQIKNCLHKHQTLIFSRATPGTNESLP